MEKLIKFQNKIRQAYYVSEMEKKDRQILQEKILIEFKKYHAERLKLLELRLQEVIII